MRNRGLWDAYVEGVLDFVNYGPLAGTGMRGPEDLEAARVQGRIDAQTQRVMARTEFNREKLLRRVEVRESGGQ